ncbi:peptidoglycan glycosyltransferase [Sphingomonas oleivorans]|uniref:Peptidoglycan glycosyltransferase n=1 Tax=Sphingomonas oleivorans TaxID=1735121 RepID=A0A2T5FY59_9SPHN|nr:penicillin-binding protein 2 [Sphingomonas oleivorans]PTQ11470.1 peptidoglycan glycosyltransferase [Sphingomonas oleivorans]
MTAVAVRRDRDRAAERVAGQRAEAISVAHFRLMVVMLLFMGVTAIIGVRLVYLLAFEGRPEAGQARDGLLPARGDIVDRNGMTLASTIDAWSIAVHPQKIVGDKGLIAADLARLMPERSEGQYLAILNSPKRFVYLRRRAVPDLVRRVNAIGEPGIAFGREPERLYPQANLASHVLGYLDQDGKAVTGMERVLDARLSDPARRGQPVQLSIDSRVQAAMESELNAAMIRHSAIGATGLVLDAHTGEVIAMASLPSYNPNRPSFSRVEDLANKATLNVYELGSTFKVLTLANAIESGVVTSMAQRYDATAPLQVGRFRIKDDHPEKRWLTIPEILIHSSNIGTARIADELGPERTAAFFRRLAFDKPADIELGARGMPLWPKFWARTTTMTVAYGHGIAVTPLHLANAYAAMVNGGVWRPATLLKRDSSQVPQGRRVISEATSARMRELMRLVVMKGTGKNANAPGLRLGGKTGTAEKPHLGGYAHKSLVSTFAGAFPMDDPRYVVIAMLDEPKGTKETFGFATAGWTAAPVISKVLSRIGPLLGVMPDESRDVDVSDALPLIWEPEGANPNAIE